MSAKKTVVITFLFQKMSLKHSALTEGCLNIIITTVGYGTPSSEIDRACENGECLILDIDVHGAYNVKRYFAQALLIFIVPPGASEQLKRLRARGENDDESIRERMDITREELACWRDYDCVIVNRDGEQNEAAEQILSAINGTIPDQGDIAELINNYFEV